MLKTTMYKLADIKKNPNNPRVVNDDKFKKLVKSIQEFPKMLEIRPIVVNRDNIVLGGNMRLKACKEAGLTEVPVIMADDLTDEQQKQFIIKDNVGFGEWDWEMLANDWDTDELEDWGLDVPDMFMEEEEETTGDNEEGLDLESYYKIEIELPNEIEQEKLYEELTGRGLVCKVLTL